MSEKLKSKLNWQKLCYKQVRREYVERLLEQFGKDVLFEEDDRGFISLHWAAIADKSDIIDLIIENGVAVDTKVRDTEEPQSIHLAALEGNIDAIDCLIRHGAQVNAEDKYVS
ncbi:putative protein S-acyltransferase 23-like protein [Dinothrombium tinctorium]|uniref:Uncharacterized protein n=1 Tax=Dinothrombium tinctorium TaxID=1965070 RepID=A0A3S3P7Z0_9ACAR|nr:putative protein S-acyltransferase 23-like protein [Dinothrombium tinctorium]